MASGSFKKSPRGKRGKTKQTAWVSFMQKRMNEMRDERKHQSLNHKEKMQVIAEEWKTSDDNPKVNPPSE
ncbi:hypothetical protein BCR35DRAFT_298816 [Leucosporidium creatinivorum]|uniref:Coiled-coil domain-containing protein n=1 Tax=Leucosporidium creatinivorum TaxID=106004 RepID=A0A1Y2G6G2_9BASI|nr:hypothetical protein BCR35DRAFT_298816 [Leucosporidium creatinivorum]